MVSLLLNNRSCRVIFFCKKEVLFIEIVYVWFKCWYQVVWVMKYLIVDLEDLFQFKFYLCFYDCFLYDIYIYYFDRVDFICVYYIYK